MAKKTPNPAIEEIVTAGEDSMLIVKNPNSIGNESYHVYSSGVHATLLESQEELNGFEKSLKMQKVTARMAEIATEDWDISWAWNLQAKTETLESLLKSANRLKMDISLTDVVIGELTEEDLPRVSKTSSNGIVVIGNTPGVWSGTPSEFEDLVKEMGIPGFEGFDGRALEGSPANESASVPSSEDLIKAITDGSFEGDPIEALYEIGKALAREEGSEDDESEVGEENV